MRLRSFVACATVLLASCAGGGAVDAGVRSRLDGGDPLDLGAADAGAADLGASDLGTTDLGMPDLGRDLGPVDLGGCVDGDGDGHGAASCGGDDCNDADRLRYPGAPERCQGTDDDCDGLIDEGSFTASFIGAGSTIWRNFDLDCVSAAAPTAPIQTVIDIESLARVYFFTASTYHVLDLLDRTWIASGARNTLMPQAAGVTLLAGVSIPAGWAGGMPTLEGMYAATATNLYVYDIDISVPSSPVFRFSVLSGGRANPIPWTAPAGLESAYLDVTGNWAPDASTVCMLPAPTMGPYTAYLTASQALIDDSGWCFLRIAEVPIATFGPFVYASAPARTAWRHTVYNAGVWAIGTPRF